MFVGIFFCHTKGFYEYLHILLFSCDFMRPKNHLILNYLKDLKDILIIFSLHTFFTLYQRLIRSKSLKMTKDVNSSCLLQWVHYIIFNYVCNLNSRYPFKSNVIKPECRHKEVELSFNSDCYSIFNYLVLSYTLYSQYQ